MILGYWMTAAVFSKHPFSFGQAESPNQPNFMKTWAIHKGPIYEQHMNLFLSMVLALIWGQLSTYFFFRGWMAFLGIIYCGVGLIRWKDKLAVIMRISFARVTDVVFFWMLLFMGFYAFYFDLDLGRTRAEMLVFLASAAVRMFIVVPQISATLDRLIKEVDDACTKNKKNDRY